MTKKVEVTQESVADNLLWGLWRSVDEDYKMRYPREIWEHFENAIRSASYTGNLKTFLSLFQRRVPTDIQAQYIKGIKSIVESGEDETVLNWLRTEATYMMMLVRLANQQRKDDLKARLEAEAETERLDFSIPHDLD